MLKNDKIFYKTEADGTRKKMTDREILNLFIVVVIFSVFAVIFAFLSTSKLRNKYDSISISSAFEKIDKNYSIEVSKILNGEETKVNIDCTDKVCIYESDLFEHKEIFTYGGKFYTISDYNTLDKSNVIETTDEGLNTYFNSVYYDLELITSIIEVSKKLNQNGDLIETNTTLERYLKEYNYKYSAIMKTEDDINIPVNLKISNYIISTIEIDYKEIDKYFNKSNYEEYKYIIKVKSVNDNNFSDIVRFFEEI